MVLSPYVNRPAIRGLSFERRMGLMQAFRGAGTLMQRYFNLVVGTFRLSDDYAVEIAREGSISHLYEPSILNRAYGSAGMFIENSWMNGGRRVLDRHGNYIKLRPATNWRAIQYLQRNQFRYLKNLEHAQQDAIGDVLFRGAKKGSSVQDIAADIMTVNRRLTHNRAMAISRAEIIYSHVSGTRETMVENEIEKYQWWATPGSPRTCHICLAFHTKKFPSEFPIYNGNIKGKTQAEAKRMIDSLSGSYSFLPVKNSHPLCRCAILADI